MNQQLPIETIRPLSQPAVDVFRNLPWLLIIKSRSISVNQIIGLFRKLHFLQSTILMLKNKIKAGGGAEFIPKTRPDNTSDELLVSIQLVKGYFNFKITAGCLANHFRAKLF